MKVFTTNWYLYKTHFNPISTEMQTEKPKTETDVYGAKMESNTPVRKWRESINELRRASAGSRR